MTIGTSINPWPPSWPPWQAEGVQKSDRLVISRTIGRAKSVAYEVTDQEPRHRRDWDRVVAVFCSGKAWQFKKWPFPGAASGDLLDTFQRMSGAYLHFNDEQIDPAGEEGGLGRRLHQGRSFRGWERAGPRCIPGEGVLPVEGCCGDVLHMQRVDQVG